MEDFYSRLEAFKVDKRLSNRELGEIVKMESEAFRVAIKRKSLSAFHQKELENYMADTNKKPQKEDSSAAALCTDDGVDNRKVASYVINNYEDLLKVKEFASFHRVMELEAMVKALKEVKQL